MESECASGCINKSELSEALVGRSGGRMSVQRNPRERASVHAQASAPSCRLHRVLAAGVDRRGAPIGAIAEERVRTEIDKHMKTAFILYDTLKDKYDEKIEELDEEIKCRQTPAAMDPFNKDLYELPGEMTTKERQQEKSKYKGYNATLESIFDKLKFAYIYAINDEEDGSKQLKEKLKEFFENASAMYKTEIDSDHLTEEDGFILSIHNTKHYLEQNEHNYDHYKVKFEMLKEYMNDLAKSTKRSS
jgi:hypothetical protein